MISPQWSSPFAQMIDCHEIGIMGYAAPNASGPYELWQAFGRVSETAAPYGTVVRPCMPTDIFCGFSERYCVPNTQAGYLITNWAHTHGQMNIPAYIGSNTDYMPAAPKISLWQPLDKTIIEVEYRTSSILGGMTMYPYGFGQTFPQLIIVAGPTAIGISTPLGSDLTFSSGAFCLADSGNYVCGKLIAIATPRISGNLRIRVELKPIGVNQVSL